MDLINSLSLFVFHFFFFFSFFRSKNKYIFTTITFCYLVVIWDAFIIKNWTIPVIFCKKSIKFEAILYHEKLLIKKLRRKIMRQIYQLDFFCFIEQIPEQYSTTEWTHSNRIWKLNTITTIVKYLIFIFSLNNLICYIKFIQ